MLFRSNVFPMIAAIAVYMYNEHLMIVCFGFLAVYYAFITQQWNFKKLLGYVNWQAIAIVAIAIMLGNYFKSNNALFEAWVKGGMFDVHTVIGMAIVSVIGFTASFLMGSSGKFVAFAVLLAKLFGPEYFLWFFAIDYSGYLLSPTHKCVMVGNRYFGTPVSTYYKALGGWAVLMLITSGIFTFLV